MVKKSRSKLEMDRACWSQLETVGASQNQLDMVRAS